MLPSTFEFILNEISNNLIRTTDGNKIPPDKQFLLNLWHNLILSLSSNLIFGIFTQRQNCIGKEFIVSCRNKPQQHIISHAFHYSKKRFSRTISPL